MKVTYISATYFDDASLIGGAERYSLGLATQMSRLVDTTLVSFSSRRQSLRKDNLKLEYYPVKHFLKGNRFNPFSLQYLQEIVHSDIVHVHNVHIFMSDLSCLFATGLGKRTFVTDHSCGTDLVLNHILPVFSCYTNAIAYSSFGAESSLPAELKRKVVVIKGGIDTDQFCPSPSAKPEAKILYSGRIVPHKGVDYLIEGFRNLNRPDYNLVVLGRVYDDRYFADLTKLAAGLNVTFITDATDEYLLNEYRTAAVTVLPSVHVNRYGDYAPLPELMGLTLLESQACGTPVVCSDAGAMHEFVKHGETGMVVKQGSPDEIAAALQHLINLSPAELSNYQNSCRQLAQSFDWKIVAQQHLDLYKKR